MKSSINVRLVVGLGLLSFAGAGAVLAAPPAGDAQEQARVLLSGRAVFQGDSKARSVALSSISATSTSATSIALDAQEQGREMILGRPAASTPATPVEHYRSRAATGPGEHKAAVDALELAREMILGSQPTANAAKTRLAGKGG